MRYILFRYIALGYLRYFVFVSIIAICGTFLSNIFDTLNRFKSVTFTFGAFLQLASLKLPYLILELIPLISFISTLFFLHHLNKTRELSAIFSSGMPILHLLKPMIICGFILGIIFTAILQPIASTLLNHHDLLEMKISKKHINQINISKTGIMIAEEYQNEKRILHIRSIDLTKQELHHITVLFTDSNNLFKKRIDAKYGKISDNKLILHDCILFNAPPNTQGEALNLYRVDTSISLKNIKDGFTDPEHISIWHLKNIITVLNNAGMSSIKHSIYYYKQLWKPMMMVATIMLATCLAQTRPRRTDNFKILGFGIASGFIIYVLNEILLSFLTYQKISPLIAISSSTLTIILLSFLIILYLHETR